MDTIWIQYGCNMDTILMQYGYNVDTMWIEYGDNMDTIWIQYEYNMDTTWTVSYGLFLAIRIRIIRTLETAPEPKCHMRHAELPASR